MNIAAHTSVSSSPAAAGCTINPGAHPGMVRSWDGPNGIHQRGVMRSIQFMVEHQDKPLQVPRLAAVAGMSPSHYFAVFKEITGFTPMDFLIRLRIQQACRLLEAAAIPVKQVAAAVGYQDPFYFSRAFRAVNGMAPTQYRTLNSTHRRRITAAVLPVYTNCTDLLKELEDSIQAICVST